MTALAKYELIQQLGGQHQRKFGEVYLAKIKDSQEQVIIKYSQKYSSSINKNDLLRSEQHFSFEEKGLPTVIDFIEMESELFLVKQFQLGMPLDDFWKTVKRKQRLTFIKNFVGKLSELLNIIHSKSIVHCDLKPSNILIQGTADNFEVELIDFGMAIEQPIKEKRALLFPLGYAAPELILNHLEIVNASADYFSLGIILWKLYNDRLPLMHPNPSIYTNLQLTYPLEDTYLPKGLYPIIARLTQKPKFRTAPNRMNAREVKMELLTAQSLRYQNSEEFMNELLQLKDQKFLGLF